MAIRNASEYERAVESEAKLKVAFDVMNYQASASEDEAAELAKQVVPSASALQLERLSFSYLGLSDNETYKVSTACL